MLNIDKKYIDYLSDLGLKTREAVIYLSCLKLGQATVSTISQDSGIQRTFVYDILEDLIKKGIASLVIVNDLKYFSVIPIEEFEQMQLEKVKRLGVIVPEIKMIEGTGGPRPKVKFFEGKEGLREAQFDTLNLPNGSEILAYATASGIYYDEERFGKTYISERVKKKIRVRAIVPETPETKELIKFNREQLRQSRLVPAEKFPFRNEIDIYGNKVAIISYQKELIAVIIESEAIAETQRMIFELAWLGAKYQGKSIN